MTMNKQYTKVKRLKKQADRLFQEVGLLLQPRCAICGQKAVVRHHFIAKSLSSGLRHEIRNGVSLCYPHHSRWHQTGDPELYEKMVSSMSADQQEFLKKDRRREIKPTQENYQRAIDELTNLNK